MDENGRYDPPPTDHAWRLEISEVTEGTSLTFTHNTNFTDIDWPPAIDGIISEGEYRHTLNDPNTRMDVYWQNDDTYIYVGLVSPGAGNEDDGKR